jgi:hypothetical protein
MEKCYQQAKDYNENDKKPIRGRHDYWLLLNDWGNQQIKIELLLPVLFGWESD